MASEQGTISSQPKYTALTTPRLTPLTRSKNRTQQRPRHVRTRTHTTQHPRPRRNQPPPNKSSPHHRPQHPPRIPPRSTRPPDLIPPTNQLRGSQIPPRSRPRNATKLALPPSRTPPRPRNLGRKYPRRRIPPRLTIQSLVRAQRELRVEY